MTQEIKIRIFGMVYNQSMGGTYSLVLGEEEGAKRRFSVLIGEAEAQSIALKMNEEKPSRPLSHDLMNSIIRELHARLIKVLIYNITNDIFHAQIHLMQGDSPVIIEARTSDAIALAVRGNAPIFIHADILNIVGTPMSDEQQHPNSPRNEKAEDTLDDLTPDKIRHIALNKLKELLTEAVKVENYELAAMLRDEIELREK